VWRAIQVAILNSTLNRLSSAQVSKEKFDDGLSYVIMCENFKREKLISARLQNVNTIICVIIKLHSLRRGKKKINGI